MKDKNGSSHEVEQKNWRYANQWMSEHPAIVLVLGICILAIAALFSADALIPPPDRPDLARKTLMSQWLAIAVGVFFVVRAAVAFLKKR